MSKKHTVDANSFKMNDSSVFHSGNFSAKYTKDRNFSRGNKAMDKNSEPVIVKDVKESEGDSNNIEQNNDELVQPLTIAGGFQDTPSSEFNDKHPLGVSLTKTSNSNIRRESLLSSSLSQSFSSSRLHKLDSKNMQSQTQLQTNWNDNNNNKNQEKTSLSRSLTNGSQAMQQKSSQQSEQSQNFIEPAGTNYSSMKLPGGFITRDIEPWINDRKSETNLPLLRRAASSGSIQTTTQSHRSSIHSSVPFGSPDLEAIGSGTSVRELTLPGAFRRNFIMNKHSNPNEANIVTKNFLEFLDLYGNFAGQDLEEDETETESGTEDDEDNDSLVFEESDFRLGSSSSPFRGRRRNSRVVKHHTKTKTKDKKISTQKAFLLLLKAFLGTGIIFLPKAFSNGGLLFANVIIILFSLISFYCFSILIQTTSQCNVTGYGDVGLKLFGKKMQFAILFSLALSQLGFASSYVVFVCKNFQQLVSIVYDKDYSIELFIILQVLIFLPISLTRSISKLGFCALIADVFILLGILYIYFQSGSYYVHFGPSDKVELFKYDTWTLFVGTAVFTYEGIGLLIPIQESMREPKKFNMLLLSVVAIITVIFTTLASISYLSFGDDIHTIIFMDFEINTTTVFVRLIYSVAILLSTPLQLFPAIKIIENYIFNKNRKTWRNKIRRNSEAISIMSNSELYGIPPPTNYDSIGNPNLNLINQEGLLSGKSDGLIKSLKNFLRVFMVLFMCGVAYLGSDNLDRFVSLIGSLTCVPLIYIYPPTLYYKKFSGELNNYEKMVPLFVLFTGCVLMSYTSYETISNW